MFWKQLIQTIVITVALPGLMLTHGQPVQEALLEPPQVEQVQPEPVYIPVLLEDGSIEAMALEEYVYRVVLGEMPMDFEVEALKAQAVAVRTYTMRRVERKDKHAGAVCTDYRCCQAYREPGDYLAEGGSQQRLDRLREAVTQTENQVLRYDGELINATYFASAGGSTEDAQAVWGSAVPYLVPVDSPDKELAKKVSFSVEELQSRLGVTLKGSSDKWIGKVSYTVGGGVETMEIGGKKFTGVKLRGLLGLRSTVFTVAVTADSVTFTTRGYGHRVGMSQYGADAMAVAGNSYQQILAHYYPGTALTKL
ncbi:MAG: stage II sporulation protein D [Oscillospiraceae bacterium]|nr:stage II sporulation protein D [Oscillospiraceae bacterium]